MPSSTLSRESAILRTAAKLTGIFGDYTAFYYRVNVERRLKGRVKAISAPRFWTDRIRTGRRGPSTRRSADTSGRRPVRRRLAWRLSRAGRILLSSLAARKRPWEVGKDWCACASERR